MYISIKVLVQSCPTLCDPVDCSLPGFSVHGIFQEEYWSGLPFPSPGDLSNPGMEPRIPALLYKFFTAKLPLIYISVKPCDFDNNSSEY